VGENVKPRLLAISGPIRDISFELSEGEFSVGRVPENKFCINDRSVSRQHCVFFCRDGEVEVRDLDSRNGTQVNGESVKSQVLKHNDQIGIGDSLFLFLLEEPGTEVAEREVEFDDSHPTHATASLNPKDVVYLQPDTILRELPAASRIARDLNALFRISQVIHAIRDLDELQAQLLELIFEVAPAERGAILLDGRGIDHVGSVYGRNRRPEDKRPVKVSRTIARQVLEQGIAILGGDIPGSSGLNQVESLIQSKVRSLLCVPMTVFERVIGCIYLDSTDPVHRFDEDNLQLVTAIAGISAVALENARRARWLEEENERLNTEVNLEHDMVGGGGKMQAVYRDLSKIARSDSTVLVGGESGTGKELAARAIHNNSDRAGKPFVAINCAAIPADLLESDLFGHEKGAFTGAAMQKKGRFEVADGGTIFLDEIGEIPLALQAKLLRVLDGHPFERVGGTRPISVDIRVIAATNRNLAECVKNGTFRQDLYQRLNVIRLVLPPLRERRDDIPMLARYFVEKYSPKVKVKAKPISPEAMACILNYDWPGNVRELENAIERALVMGSSDTIMPEDLPETLLEVEFTPEGESARYHSGVKEFKKQMIRNALEEANGSYVEAARFLGIHPNNLHRLIRNLGLRENGKGGKGKGPAYTM
jgi:Nif-specific regulatory protein